MLIGTLPTLVSPSTLIVAENMIAHPAIAAVRYNTGGDSPLAPLQILSMVKKMTDKYGKTLYVDLEGRQLRIARWTPFESGMVVLNRDFSVKPPARIFIRNAGWFDLVAAKPKERKVYVENGPALRQYYFGESQSTHIVGGDFEVQGYLGGLDFEYIEAAKQSGITNFMLSFVEDESDLDDFYVHFPRRKRSKMSVVLKIESQKGLAFIRSRHWRINERLMAARDDLFISFGENPVGIYEGLKQIIKVDPSAIVASRILHGFQSTGIVTMGDIADIILMSRIGYRNFMFSDGIAKKFPEAIKLWEEIKPSMEV
ncbi:MAG: hypothetical protein UW46_C0004G0019 [Candidatus Yanofskybacteria bacterium GW2011_GWF1_44_227]|uniref:Uncharacterized protein n=1 Tax=Candidatus Yanofskybacteria bacterium GW2011_GWE2_40_11 TaxID=1619033 RepID=A0A0G0QHW1_9BACT|nr:MAG: hypothetical protein UT75_C0012G0008 [Candidatus Yanofskybacteria bacterium GW2011_GWE2_40_11]KKT15226.1 MAG: hypothetical protein UV97_C0010G0009 [Candidatus Yanofskybacteria bacterium GW2011_GWF2_43_596]KKT53292.1 MAG: hypothetical protein UW46_C0004G0019 [Candidatus Yanofskybacteria bacterium GW2011_GWF1_44_227]OGN36473.1 MAG: hypothetical protein A2241_01890 [Candidatus Yanofskybacteria bacterium RIFOXYA2_FULL_45_28]OGN37346.1 MAG: hypothetical protein A2371_00045 [Candidatus Yanofs